MPSKWTRVLDSVNRNPVLGKIFLTAHASGKELHGLTLPLNLLIATFRGIGQVAFVNSAVSGVAIFVGCTIERPIAGLSGFIATLTCTLLSYAIRDERSACLNGLHGYNAFLLGMGLGYFDDRLNSERSDWIQFARILLPLLLTSVICFLVHVSLSKSLSTPAFTFAYNITLTSWLAYAVSLGRDSFLVPSFYSRSFIPLSPDPILYSELDFGWFVKSTLAGIGQVFFAPELTSSIIITGGLAIGSPIAALLAIFGSAMGNTIAIISEGSRSEAEMGIYGLSAVLCAIALGGFYFVFSFRSVVLSFFGSVFCVGMTSVFSGLLVRPVGPSMTFPFCTVATFLYLAGMHVPGLVRVPNHLLESPERHLAHHLEDKIEH